MAQNNNFTVNSTANPQNTICAEEYVVKRGDSFYLISHKLGVPLRDLLAANRDIHPARLMVGDVLCIPREEDDSPPNNETTNGSNNTPGNGTLGGGTDNMTNGGNSGMNGTNAANGTTQETSPNGNGMANGANGTQSGSTNGASTIPGETETPAPPATSCPSGDELTVQSGQTVADIQLRNLVSRNTLTTANPNVNLDQLQTGQVLCVPRENIPCPIPSTYTLQSGESLESVAIRYNLPVASVLRSNPCLAPQDFEEGVTVILPR